VRCAFEKLCDEAGVKRVSCTIGDQAAQDRLADQGEIPQQIESLVPYKLVSKTKRGIVHYAGLGEDNRILERSASDQTPGLKLFHVVVKTECARRRDTCRVIRTCQLDLDALLSDERMWEIDGILNAKDIGGVDAQGLLTFLEHERLRDPDVPPRRPLRDYANASDCFRIGKSAPVENRDFKVIQLDIGIIDSDTIQRRKEMFDRRNPNAPAHQCRRIGHARYGADIREKLEIVQIDTAKDDAFVGGSWKNPHCGVFTSVEADPAEFDRMPERLLMHQAWAVQLLRRISLT